MRVINLLIFMFIGSCLYGQTFTNTVTVQKDLRVQGETVLGGVSKLEDITMYADTIHIGNLDGTGSLLVIDGSGKVTKGTAGAGAVTGLANQQVLYGKSDGTIDQEAAFVYDESIDLLTITSTVGGGFFIDGTAFNDSYMSEAGFGVQSFSAGVTYVGELYSEKLRLDVDGFETNIFRTSGGSDYSLYLPNAQGGANTFLKNDGSGNLSWASAGTVTSIATTSPITGGTITTTGTIGINDAAADGSTKGAASFTANDFDASSGNISIDYVNGQKASASVSGFVSTAAQDIAGVKTFQSAIELEGATANAFETTISATDPTADNTVTIQDLTGTLPVAFGTDVSLTGQNAAIAFNTIYTTPAADGWYRMNINLVLTTAATSSSQIGFRIRYTSAADGVVKTSSNINDLTRTTANTTGTTLSYSAPIYVDASTNIQYETAYTSTGATAAVYAIYITLEKIK